MGLARRLVALPVAIAAAALLTVGVPHTIGVLISARAEPILRLLQDQHLVETDKLRSLIAVLGQAQPWLRGGDARLDAGLAELVLAEQLPRGDPEAAQVLDQAIASLRAGLEREPANPYAWSRLAYAEALKNGWTPLAVSSLRLALITAPYEPPLLWSRLRMAFLAWPKMTSDDRDLVFPQIRYAWQANPQALARLAVDLRQENLVRAALLRVPEDGLAFEDLIKH